MPIDLKDVEENTEMKQLQSALYKIKDISMNFVADADDKTEAMKRARDITKKLAAFFGGKCPPGTIFDPVTGTCV